MLWVAVALLGRVIAALTMKKKMYIAAIRVIRVALYIAIWITFLTLAVKLAHAISDPDSMSITTARAYSGTIETGDMLVVVQYRIDYTVLPTETAADAFVCRFMRGTTELNASEIYAFNNKGYGVGVCSFYWTNLERIADSIEFGDPNGESYEVVVQGKPTAFPDPPRIGTTSITYRSATNTEQLLQTDIENIAFELESDPGWAGKDLITFTAGKRVFTQQGEDYFSRAIPNLQIMTPDLFRSSTTQPFVEERQHPKTYGNSLSNFWVGTPVDTWLTSTSAFLQVDKKVISSLIALFIMGLIVFLVTQFAGQFELGLLGAAVTLPIFVRIGWMTMPVGAIVAFMAILAIGWAFFLRRAG